MVAGTHALAELPDEITTPGKGQIRALFLNSGNPVISGPNGGKFDRGLASLPRNRTNELVVHPKDVADLGISDGDRVRVRSA